MKKAIVILDPDILIHRQILLGLSEELQCEQDWDIRILHGQLPLKRIERLLESVKPDAIIARCPSEKLVDLLSQGSLPLVVVADEGPAAEHTTVVLPDNARIGAMAAAYLLGQKFEHFGVVLYKGSSLDTRIIAYGEAIEQRRKTLDRFELSLGTSSNHSFGTCGSPRRLVRWLRDLPKPCAILAHSDPLGAHVIRTCVHHGIAVPADVAVIGVDDDPLFCQTVSPRLASIRLPYRRIGIEAAQLLRDWKPGRRLVLVPPTDIVERASCRPPHRGNPDVDRALEYLRKEVAKGVKVKELQDLTGLTTHQLVYRFNLELGCTPMEMILRERIAVAKRLLVETQDAVNKVGRMSGFNSATQFYATFRTQVGLSPSEYRNSFSP